VEGGLGPPLGVAPLTEYEETDTELLPGSTIVLYTDGLVERRRESLDEGLQRLKGAMAQAPEDLDGLCDEIIHRLLGAEGAPDDAAVLAVRREPLAGQTLRLSFAAEPRRIPSIRRHIGRWLRGNGFGDDDVSEILVACTEACTNAIQHAYGLKEGLVELVAWVQAGEATITVRDFGRWKAPATTDREDAGRGLPLMRGLMDTVDVVSGEGGTTVTMQRRARGVGEHD
jgi:anti-sigma regulatory factor (Ser/Thr protein kinase)